MRKERGALGLVAIEVCQWPIGHFDIGLQSPAERVTADMGRLELEIHRHAVAAEAEEHALPQAEDAAEAPAQHQADGDEGVGEILRDQIEPEDIERQRQDHHQDHGQHRKPDELVAIDEARILDHDARPFTCGL